ncbi:MAG: hypothetical protein PGN29_12345, partial [Gordonia paraffinivorans]
MRIAGVRVGTVQSVQVHDHNLAKVRLLDQPRGSCPRACRSTSASARSPASGTWPWRRARATRDRPSA